MAYESFDHIMQLATGYWQAAALNSAVSLGVFAALDSEHPRDADAIALQCELSTPHTHDLLNALTGMGLLVQSDGGYVVAPEYRAYLLPSGGKCMLGALSFNANMYNLWGKLSDAMRKGKPVVPPQAHLGDDPTSTRGFVMGMHSRALGLAEVILPAIDIAQARHLLDIGSGPGTFSRMLAEKHQALHVMQFDLPGVLDVARELTTDSPAADRITFCPGSYREGALPTGCDAALYCGALHQETEASALDLFKRLLTALEPDGAIHVIDLMTDATGTNPVFSRLFSLNMKLFNPVARVFTAERTAELLREAGFIDVVTRHIAPSPYWLVNGMKPSD